METDPLPPPLASLREYLDGVVVDKAHVIFENFLDPFVRDTMREAFPEVADDPCILEFEAKRADAIARLHEIDTVEMPAAKSEVEAKYQSWNAAGKAEKKVLKKDLDVAKKQLEKCTKEREKLQKEATAQPTPGWVRACQELFGRSMQLFVCDGPVTYLPHDPVTVPYLAPL